MEKEFQYIKYINNKEKYFKELLVENNDILKIPKFKENIFKINSSEQFWCIYELPNLPLQGFKIHISSSYETAERTLEIVSRLCYENKVSFKFIKDKKSLFWMYSKNGDRISAGKFIVIYPKDNREFLSLLNILYDSLKNEPEGPYILTDKRFKNSNIYYRYGAFKYITNSNGDYFLKDPNGDLILDERKPFFTLPEFIKLPKELENEELVTNEETKLDLYNIDEAIKFSNSGGIYIATEISNGKKYIIKEARPFLGIDREGKYVVDRLKSEANSLITLKALDNVVDFIDYFKLVNNEFLVLEFISGISLGDWVSENYPLKFNENTDNYFKKCFEIIKTLKDTLNKIHESNIAICDLKPENIMIGENFQITIIDFETASSVNDNRKNSMRTRGFSHNKVEIAKDKDFYSLNRIFHFLLLPLNGSIFDLDKQINSKHCYWIYNTFGEENYKIFYDFQLSIKNKITNFYDIFGNTYLSEFPFKDFSDFDTDIIIDKLKNGLLSNINLNSYILLNGNLNQYEKNCGIYNILNGSFGGILALHRINAINLNIKIWIEKQVPKFFNGNYNKGLFSGRSGIALVLYELGYKEEAIEILNIISKSELNIRNCSLKEGLSGIGLSLISLHKENISYISKSEKIADLITKIIDNKYKKEWIIDNEIQFGLLSGYSGIALFYIYLYKVTKKEIYMKQSKKLIEQDLNLYKTSINELSSNKENLFISYAKNTAVGICIAIFVLNEICGKNFFQKEFDSILNRDDRIEFESSIFYGLSSQFLFHSISKAKHLIKNINLFFIENESEILLPSKMFYKLSSDIQTGNAGTLLALLSCKFQNPLFWLPVIHNILDKEDVN